MRIAVLGTGVAGRTVAGRLAELGHDVRHGTRDPAATRGREDWSDVPGTTLATFADAVADADLVVNASNGMASLEVLATVAEQLAGKVLLDLANPLDFSQGFPPSLSVSNTDSLAEQIQRAHPDVRVVKALNTMNAGLMVHPETLADADHTVFVCGDDEGAKATVTALLHELGHTDVLDLGGLDGARGTEMVLPLWVRLMQQLGTVHFQLKVVR
ncbi:NADPH-dependent F420 reductase [Nocardioides iriomotensis]|uniref:NADP oxidoreductase n=1 Tax=Nocardioides iriomotensis TaxID=715784 RepID=A0A4Q5IW44_9ACTN|nr:NAD(P)-binding domain-containing protein [Nocardioides iriomotensis]RYU10224.1 NADP oxidoreductase [Nocardioides iriomotensis]